MAVAGPAGVPKPGVERAHQAVRSAVAVSEVRVALLAQGLECRAHGHAQAVRPFAQLAMLAYRFWIF